MIKCNLAVILAERNMKISQLAEETRISRTTLTALAYNHGKGIQYDTLDTLCEYLDISPGQLLTRYSLFFEILGRKEDSKEDYTYSVRVFLDDEIFDSEIYLVFKNDSIEGGIQYDQDFYNKLAVLPQEKMIEKLQKDLLDYLSRHEEETLNRLMSESIRLIIKNKNKRTPKT